MDFTGKTALITGTSRGIGASAARIFAAAGANVALVARSAEPIEKLADEIGSRALALPCDVANYAALKSAVEQAHSHFGSVDILINNAGMLEPISRLMDADPDAWGQVIDVNLKGVFNGMHAVLPIMIAQGGGHILTISSGAAHHAYEGWSHYCASKAGAHLLTQSLHLENAAHGIRAMGLSPGTVATQMQREIKTSGINPVSDLAWEDHISPQWPARALLWMCTPEAEIHCGQELSLRDEGLLKKIGVK